MSDVALVTIITDQDRAMEVALPIVFPNTFQRFCKWHITHEFPDKIENVYRDKLAMTDFHDFLNNSESTDEFDSKWNAWTSRHNLSNHKWLDEIFQIRHKWCPPYMTNYFFAGMSSTQRSESMNHHVKMRVKPCFTLYEFIGFLKIVLMSMSDKELRRDYDDTFGPPHLITNLLIERSLLHKYTSEAFRLYQEQVKLSLRFFIKSCIDSMHSNIYPVVNVYN